MKRRLVVLALAAAVAVPVAVSAQPGPGMGPPPEMRAKLDAVHAQAKTDAYAALTPDHRARVGAIVAQVSSGKLAPRDAVAQIDALLTPEEKTALGGVERATHDRMRAAFRDAAPGGAAPPPPPGGGPGDGPPPGGAPGAGGPPGGAMPPSAMGSPAPGGERRGGWRHRPSSGGFLLMVSLTPEQMRALHREPPAH